MREQTICSAVDQGFGAAAGNVSDAVSIRTVSAGKGPEELKCISWNSGHCVCRTPVPDQWLGLPDCGWGWPRPTGAHTALQTVCGKCGELRPSVLGPQGAQGGGNFSTLLVEIKQAATNPSVPLHWVHLVFLGSCFKTCAANTGSEVLFWAVTGWVFCLSSGVNRFSFHIL